MVNLNVITKTCCILWRSEVDSDDEVCLWVKAQLMHGNGDVPELKDWGEIYSIIYPAGVSLWLSVNPWDLLPDLEVLSLHTTSGSVPEGINSSGFFLMTVRTSMKEVWQVGKKHWNRSSSFFLCLFLLSFKSINHPWTGPSGKLVGSSLTLSILISQDRQRTHSGAFLFSRPVILLCLFVF